MLMLISLWKFDFIMNPLWLNMISILLLVSRNNGTIKRAKANYGSGLRAAATCHANDHQGVPVK